MTETPDQNAFIGEYTPADWLSLKEEVLDPKAEELEQILPLIEERARNHPDELDVLDCISGEGQFTVELHRATNSSKVVGLDNFRKYMMTVQRTGFYTQIQSLQAKKKLCYFCN